MFRKLLRWMCLALMIISGSCTNCDDLECVSSDQLLVRFEAKDTGANLVGGNAPTVTETNLKCEAEGTDSSLQMVDLAFATDGVYLSYDVNLSRYYLTTLGKTDTLDLTFKTRDTECCGTITDIITLTSNGTEVVARYSNWWEVVLNR